MAMDFLRKKKSSIFTSLIFGAIIVTFVLWGGYQSGGEGSHVLTTVNGEEILYLDFKKEVGQRLEQFKKFMGANQPMHDSFVYLIEQQVAKNMTLTKILSQKAITFGIQIGNQEILEELKKFEAFQDPHLKRFSPNIYKEVLELNQMTPVAFEQKIREEITFRRFINILEELIQISEAELLEAWQLEQTNFSLDIATFNVQKLVDQKKISITSSMIEEHFKQHPTEYISLEKKKAMVGFLTLKNSQNQTQWKEQIEKKVAQYKKSKMLPDLLNQDGFEFIETKPFDRETRLNEVPLILLHKASKAPQGEWEGPILHENKFYVYQVTETLPPQPLPLAEARPKILSRLQKEGVEQLTRNAAEQLKNHKISWKQVAEKGAQIQTHKNLAIYKITEIPKLGVHEPLLRAAQQLTPQTPYSAPLYYNDQWIIFYGHNFSKFSVSVPEAEKLKLKERLISERKVQLLDSYTEDLIKNATIPKEFREKYKI